jgi:hypothetical protein
MNITVVRSGGFAGLRRTWRVDVDPQSRTVLDEWRDVVEACPWSEGVDLDGDGVPDRFVFIITVESLPVDSSRDSPLQATLPEGRVVGPWKHLVDRVQSADRADTQRP